MELEHVVPWGRSFAEYCSMFSLTEQDLAGHILGCSDGPASFNAELTNQNGSVISVDPVYHFDSGQLRDRIDEVYPQVMDQVRTHADKYVWQHISDPDDLAATRMQAMNQFLSDYETGRAEGRYQAASLPELPFTDQQFDLALCSHFLFLYSDHLDAQQHVDAMLELARVAKEVRVYPLITLNNAPSPYLSPVLAALSEVGLLTEIRRVGYQFQQGAGHMLVVSRV